MKQDFIKFLGFTLIVFFFISACQPTSNTNNASAANDVLNVVKNIVTVVPPFKSLDVSFQEFSIRAEKGGKINLDNGSIINVPKNAFVGTDGTPIKGKVNLQYREFHKPAEIIASGIPMTNRDDHSKYMATAGMFELRGKQEQHELEVANDKTISIEMASYVPGNEYDFFYLDEDDGVWEDRGTAAPKPNKTKQQKIKNLPKLPKEPVKPAVQDKSKFVFDLDINYQNLPELKSFRNVVWQYAGNSNADDPQKNKWIFKENWVTAKVLPKDKEAGEYFLELRTTGKQFKTTVKPVLKGKDLEKQLLAFQSKVEEYQTIKKTLKDERKRLKKEADLVRSFRVNNFGVYNWDVWKQPDRILVNANFEFGKLYDKDINKISIFLVTEDNQSVVRFSVGDFDKFSFNPYQKNKMVAVLPNDQIAVFSKADFKKINLDLIKDKNTPYTFKFKVLEERITSVKDFQKKIDELG